MTYQTKPHYEAIPVNPNYAAIVPVQPQPMPMPPCAPPVAERKPSPIPALALVGVIGLAVIGLPNQGSGSSVQELEARNAQLHQENLYLRNQVDQLQYQLMGVYSAQ